MRSRRQILIMGILAVILIGPLFSQDEALLPRETLETQRPIRGSLISQEIGAVVLTEHGTNEYLGNGLWRYRSSVGETNTWNGTHYLRYEYDLDNKQVSIGKLTFTHGPNGVISITHSESGSMVGELKWYAQYYLSDQWNNFTFDNYEYLGATQNEDNATINQRWWSTNGELNVTYTYHYWNELKMRAQATNWAAQTVPVRVLWALSDIKINPDYTLIYDSGVAVGVELGNEQTIFWHDVTESTPEININPVLDKDNRRAAVVFGNMSSILAQGETLDIDPTYTVAADSDDDTWGDPYGTPTHYTTLNFIQYTNDTDPVTSERRGQFRVALSIPQYSAIVSADAYGYDRADQATTSHNVYRIDEANVGSLEGDSTMPTIDETPTATFDTDGAVFEWSDPIDITALVQEQVNLAGWSSGNYMGIAIETPTGAAVGTFQFEDYQDGGSNHAYFDVTYVAAGGEFDYVDVISDLHSASDVGTHSSFAEMQDKDGTYDTLTEADNGVPLEEWVYVDGLSTAETVWSTTGASPYLDAQDQPTNMIDVTSNGATSSWYTFGATSGTGTGFTVNCSVYHDSDSDSFPDWEVDWTGDGTADASGSFTTGGGVWKWENTGTISGLDTATEINAARIRFTHDKGGAGPDNVAIDVARLGVSQTPVNYDLDLEVGWLNADYDETTEELCIFGGTQDTENLRVDVWGGSSWVNLISDVVAGWNNNSVSSYLNDPTFEIRFTDTSNESTKADAWPIEGVLLRTYSAAGAEYTENIFEVLPLSESGTESMDASQTIYELIEVQESSTAAASFSTAIYELIDLYDSSIAGAGYGIVVLEIIGMYESVAVAMDAVLIIFEQIDFSETVSTGVNFVLTILEVLGLAATVVTTKGGAAVTIFETIGFSGTVTNSMSASITILETIGFSDLTAAYRGFYVTVFESIGMYDSTATSQTAHFYIFEVIGLIESVSAAGGTAGVPTPTGSFFYQVFFSANMWGILGPMAIVVGGYFVARKETSIGVIWFVFECVLVAQYLALVGTTPNYWWPIFLLLFGGMFTIVYPLWGNKR